MMMIDENIDTQKNSHAEKIVIDKPDEKKSQIPLSTEIPEHLPFSMVGDTETLDNHPIRQPTHRLQNETKKTHDEDDDIDDKIKN
jgi:hypothetical protein